MVCQPGRLSYRIRRNDVAHPIQLLLNGTIDKDTLVEWVNVTWFTELYVFDDKDADCIISVFEVLETLDEEDVDVFAAELYAMIDALKFNREYAPKY